MIISLQQPPDFNLIKYQNKSAIVAVGRRIISVTKKTKKKKKITLMLIIFLIGWASFMSLFNVLNQAMGILLEHHKVSERKKPKRVETQDMDAAS